MLTNTLKTFVSKAGDMIRVCEEELLYIDNPTTEDVHTLINKLSTDINDLVYEMEQKHNVDLFFKALDKRLATAMVYGAGVYLPGDEIDLDIVEVRKKLFEIFTTNISYKSYVNAFIATCEQIEGARVIVSKIWNLNIVQFYIRGKWRSDFYLEKQFENRLEKTLEGKQQ